MTIKKLAAQTAVFTPFRGILDGVDPGSFPLPVNNVRLTFEFETDIEPDKLLTALDELQRAITRAVKDDINGR